MSVAVHAHSEGGRGRATPANAVDLAHALDVARALEDAGPHLEGRRAVEIDLAQHASRRPKSA